MKEKNPNCYKRKEENETDINVCNHGKDMWCQNCLKVPEKIDLRKQGLGQGFIISNV